jgi:hypothetical protein
MFLRVAIALQTLVLFAAPITAGLLMSISGGRTWHSVSAYGVFTVTLFHLITAILVWRPGGGSPRPILYAAGFFGLALAQIALGIAHVKALHVPLGTLMFGLSLLQLSRVRTQPTVKLTSPSEKYMKSPSPPIDASVQSECTDQGPSPELAPGSVSPVSPQPSGSVPEVIASAAIRAAAPAPAATAMVAGVQKRVSPDSPA